MILLRFLLALEAHPVGPLLFLRVGLLVQAEKRSPSKCTNSSNYYHFLKLFENVVPANCRTYQ